MISFSINWESYHQIDFLIKLIIILIAAQYPKMPLANLIMNFLLILAIHYTALITALRLYSYFVNI